jgi:hypothetical protein
MQQGDFAFPSMRASSRPLELDREEPLDEVDYICIAADLLQKMFEEIRSLAQTSPALAREIALRESLVRADLRTLNMIVEVLSSHEDALAAMQVRRRASALISRLWDALDSLTSYVTGVEYPEFSPRRVLH